MANPRYNTQVTQPRGSSARVGKMGGGMMRPMYKKGGRVKKMGGGRIAGAARRAQEHGYYTPDMGMKGGRMYRDGGKVGKKKPRVKVIGIGKAKDYPGIKKIIEMNKKGKKRFRDGGSALKAVDKSKNPGLAKLPTQVRNKMGYMKAGGKVKSKKSEHPLAGRQGNLLHKLKSQKQIKAITDTKKYKDASYNEKNKMLQAGGAYTKSAPDKKGRISRRDGGNTRRMNRLEELGRVDAERGFTRKGKKNLRAEKKRIVRELKK
jgi:hypothetical protein